MGDLDLVTGASGLLGGNLVRVLSANGRRVRVLARRSARLDLLRDVRGVEIAYGDITDPAALPPALAGVDTVYHCAARVTLARRMTAEVWRANVGAVEDLLAAARHAGVRRVVHCSSVDALGLPAAGKWSDEETPWNWDRLGLDNAYARSKYQAQQRALAAAQAGQDVVVVCPTYMFGAFDQRPSSGQMILSAARSPFRLGMPGGNNFVDVLDVAEGMLAAAQSAPAGRVYILGNANWSYDTVFACIADVLGKRAPRLPLPYGLALGLGQAGDLYERLSGREALINSPTARLGFTRHYYNPARAEAELGLARRPVEDAIRRAVDWFRQAGMLPELR
jgi:dihydroflavonol-4-reductase